MSPQPDPDELRRAFDRAHEERYGYCGPRAGLELVSVRVAVALPGADPRAAPSAPSSAARAGGASARRPTRRGGPARRSSTARRSFELPGATLVVPPGWRAGDADAVVIER